MRAASVGLSALVVAAAILVASSSATGAPQPVLGSKKFGGDYGKGFGRVAPQKIYNGGSLSGLVKKIDWDGWGRATAKGHGRGYQYKPSGGYYSDTVIVRFRAKKLDRCKGSKRPAYTQLKAQFQKKPDSKKYTRWFNWAGSRSICKLTF